MCGDLEEIVRTGEDGVQQCRASRLATVAAMSSAPATRAVRVSGLAALRLAGDCCPHLQGRKMADDSYVACFRVGPPEAKDPQ